MPQRPRTSAADRPRAGYRLMHVHAHPDDESSKGAASTAMYVAEGVDVHVVTCTGGERGSILNPKMERPDILANITEVRRQEMERARDILGVRQDWLGLRRLRLAGGRPEAAAAGGVLRHPAGGGGGRPAGAADAQLPAARRDDVRRARRLPAPRPRHVPQGVRGGVRGGRRPRPLPRAGGAVAAAQALLPPRLQPSPHPGAARRDAAARARVALRRAAREVGARAGVGRPDHHEGAVLGLLRRARPGADGARHPDRPGRCRGSRSRTRSRRAVWPTEDFELVVSHVESPIPEDDLFAGIPHPDGSAAPPERMAAWRSPTSSCR